MENKIAYTKETKEGLIALISIVEFLAERFQDGVGYDDALSFLSKLFSDDVFVKKIKNGFEGIDKISQELKALDTEAIAALGFEIAPDVISLLSKVKSVKKI
jgi:hypothetical protein